MAKPVKEFSTKGWKHNPELREILNNGELPAAADYINSPKFSEKDYIDLLTGMYSDNGIDFHNRHWGAQKKIKEALDNSRFNRPTVNDKALDFAYDVKNMKEDWNKKNPKAKLDLDDDLNNIKGLAKNYDLSSKKLNELITQPKYMVKDRYSDKQVPVDDVLKNNKIKSEHLYKFLQSHPEQADEVINHHAADDRLHDLIFSNPEHVKHLSNHNLEAYLSKNVKSGRDPEGRITTKLGISPKRAKEIVESSHDKLYNDALYRTLDAMDPADKKSFIDRKLGITGGKKAGLASWRTNDDAANQELDGNWDDWENGPEHDVKFANRIASSPHLSEDQVEHIKRHGNFDAKYNIYHNKSVDPKHGAEMFKMWHDNDENKGYHAQQLQDKYKQDKDDIYSLDDLDPDLIDEEDLYDSARESAEQNYSFPDWVDDNKDDILKDSNFETKSDNVDEDIDESLRNDHDWTGDNPDYDRELDKHHQAIINSGQTGEDYTHVDQIPEITGGKTAEDLGIGHLADGDGNIQHDDIVEHSQENNPEEIDFSSHDTHSISDHPDYEDRYVEARNDHFKNHLRNNPWDYYDDFYEDYNNSDKYQEANTEAMKEAKEEAAQPHYKELYQSSHQDDRFIPEHLHAHIPNIEELKAKRKKATGEPTDFLDKHTPNRAHTHAYGDDQHLHELLKDYADANGGNIDIGRMHKLMPNQGEAWKKIFGTKGKLSSGEIQQKIDAIPKTNYEISYGKWDKDKMQNVNKRDQMIFRLDHSDESLKPLQEDPALYDTFKRVQEVSKRSGHPTKDKTIAWARVDTNDPKHWMIDEVQSDFGKTVRDYLKKEGSEEKADHIQKISDYHKNWRENLMNHVINEAKKHGVEKISTHSPESKASHTGAEKAHSVYQDSYKKVPRQMGFKPAKASELPLAEGVQESVFRKDKDQLDPKTAHTDAWNEHKGYAQTYGDMAAMFNTSGDKGLASSAQKMAEHHEGIAGQHRTKALEHGADHDDVSMFSIPSSSSSDLTQKARAAMDTGVHLSHPADKMLQPGPKVEPQYHEGHTLNLKPNLVKAMLDIVEDLVKFELIVQHSPNEEITKRAYVNINLIKNLFGYEPDLSKWQARRKMAMNDLEKAVNSPNKHIGLGRLKQIQTDNGIGAGGQEYDEGELKNAINERGNAVAQKMVRNAGKQEKEMAQRAQDQANGVGGADPKDFPMFNKPKMPAPVANINQGSPKIRQIADQYAQSKGLKLQHGMAPVKVDEKRASKIASAYHMADHEPNDPAVQKAYQALIGETGDQFKHILKSGLKISKIKPGQENPYKNSKDLFHDIHNNNHIYYFPTEQGFGPQEGQEVDHPLNQPTKFTHEGEPMVANDIFRIVHDYFGHAKEGHGFGPNGEENAWRNHMQMYTPEAQKALTAETRGQNSWVNYGPFKEHNRKSPENTRYADQKATILPDWAHETEDIPTLQPPMKKSETDLMKGRPKQIELQTGKNKGRVVNVVRDNPDKSHMGIKAINDGMPLIVNKKSQGHVQDTHNTTVQWDRNRKHRVVTEGSKSKTPVPPSQSSGWSDTESRGYRKNPNAKGKLMMSNTHPGIPHSPVQQSLLHGIDLSKVKQNTDGWTSSETLSGFGKNSKKKNVVVKGHMPRGTGLGRGYDPESGGLSTAQREALYHNLAHNAFGMGKYVPTTSVADLNGDHYSVMEKIPGASHFEKYNPKHHSTLKKINKSGDLHKLAIMNMIMGNSDRHGGNFMMSPKGMHLIDHGLTFNYNDNGRDIFTPSYLEYAKHSPGESSSSYDNREEAQGDLHPEAAKWLKGLNLKQFQAHLKAHKIPSQFKKSILGSLQAAKKAVNSGDLGDVLGAIKKFHKNNTHEE